MQLYRGVAALSLLNEEPCLPQFVVHFHGVAFVRECLRQDGQTGRLPVDRFVASDARMWQESCSFCAACYLACNATTPDISPKVLRAAVCWQLRAVVGVSAYESGRRVAVIAAYGHVSRSFCIRPYIRGVKSCCHSRYQMVVQFTFILHEPGSSTRASSQASVVNIHREAALPTACIPGSAILDDVFFGQMPDKRMVIAGWGSQGAQRDIVVSNRNGTRLQD